MSRKTLGGGMTMRKFMTIVLLAPAAYQLLAGSIRERMFALAALMVFAAALVAAQWAKHRPEHWVSRVLFSPRLVRITHLAFLCLGLLGLYVTVVLLADKLDVLDSPVVLTVAFVAVFLGLIAFAAVVDRSFQRLRRRRPAA